LGLTNPEGRGLTIALVIKEDLVILKEWVFVRMERQFKTDIGAGLIANTI